MLTKDETRTLNAIYERAAALGVPECTLRHLRDACVRPTRLQYQVVNRLASVIFN